MKYLEKSEKMIFLYSKILKMINLMKKKFYMLKIFSVQLKDNFIIDIYSLLWLNKTYLKGSLKWETSRKKNYMLK